MNETIKNILPAKKTYWHSKLGYPDNCVDAYNSAIDHCAAAIERAVKEGKIIITDNESCCCNKDKPFLKLACHIHRPHSSTQDKI